MRENPGEARDVEAPNSDESSLPVEDASLPQVQAHSPFSEVVVSPPSLVAYQTERIHFIASNTVMTPQTQFPWKTMLIISRPTYYLPFMLLEL